MVSLQFANHSLCHSFKGICMMYGCGNNLLVCVYMCIWVLCTYAHVYIEARCRCQMSSYISPFLFLKIVFNHEPENHQFAYTRGPVSSRDLAVSLLPTLYFLPISRVAEFYLDMAFIWLQVTGTQVLMIMQ